MKLTDETIDVITDSQWGKQTHLTAYQAHRAYARAIESTVRQQDAELVRELVEALVSMDTLFSHLARDCTQWICVEKSRGTITRAQQWLEENKCP